MQNLINKLKLIGLSERHSVDIFSVLKGARQRGLLHLPIQYKNEIKSLLSSYGLNVIYERNLYQQKDPYSREGVLSNISGEQKNNYSEVWFSRHDLGSTMVHHDDIIKSTGEALGYPDCCVKYWERHQSQKKLYYKYLFEDVETFWEINRLSAIFYPDLFLMPDFFPCSLSCEHARKYSQRIMSLIDDELPVEWSNLSKKMMKSIFYIRDRNLYCFPDWVIDGEIVLLEAATASKCELSAISDEFGNYHKERLIPNGETNFLSQEKVIIDNSIDGNLILRGN